MSEKQKILKAMYRGELPIGDLNLKCAVLDDETRILSTKSIFEAFGRSKRGLDKARNEEILATLSKIIPNHGWAQVPPFLGSKSLISLIDTDLFNVLQPVQYYDGETLMQGYRAELLPQLCNLYLKGRRQGILTSEQKRIAGQAEILLGSLANVGIAALIDEATGFQYNRKKDALRFLLEKYITEGLQKWLKRFPDKFFEELDRLYKNEKTTSRARPQYYGAFINTHIYEPIEEGYLKAKLNELNITDEGKRKARFHQWLTDFGLNQLTLQIGRVMGVVEDSKTLNECKLKLARQKGLTILEEDLFGTNEKIIKKSDKQKAIHLDLAEAMENNIPKNNPNFESAMDKIASTIKIKP